MKRRKNLVLAILLIAALTLGIGYAALSEDLLINGSATIKEDEAEEAFGLDVYFDAAAVGQHKTDVALADDVKNTAGVVEGNNDEATFAVNTLRGAGDYADFTFTVKNKGDLEATVEAVVTSVTDSKADKYFTVTTNWVDGDNTLEVTDGTAVLAVRVTLNKTPLEELTGTFVIDLTAEAK